MNVRRTLTCLAFFLLQLSASVEAQAVRGRVYEPARTGVIPGAIVTLVDSAGTTRASSLSDANGAFFLNAGRTGIYALRVDRIGYERGHSQPFLLEAGDTISVSFEAQVAPVALEAVSTEADRVCRIAPEASQRINALWTEARKTLEIALRTEAAENAPLFEYTRYVRELDEEGRRVLREPERQTMRNVGSPYRGAPVDVLEASGFMSDSMVFVPTAELLLSDFFLSTHCFTEAVHPGDSIGINFEPIGQRRSLPEIAGTFWLEPEGALRRIDVHYVNLFGPLAAWPPRASITFRTLSDGRIAIDRWFVRTPLTAQRGAGSMFSPVRSELIGVQEEGGELQRVTDERGVPVLDRRHASIGGVVFDSTLMAPLPGVRVFLSGTEMVSVSDAEGVYFLSQVPAGEYRLATAAVRIDSLGVSVPWQTVAVPDRPIHLTVDVHVPAARPVLVENTERRAPASAASTVRLVGRVVDDATSAPIVGAAVRIGALPAVATDAAGGFVVTVAPGTTQLAVEHLAYGTLRQEYEVSPAPGLLEVRLSETAIALRPIEVEVTADRRDEIRLVGTPSRVVNERVLAEYNQRGARMEDLIRARILGVNVRSGMFRTRDSAGMAVRRLCIESTRGLDRLQTPPSEGIDPFCEMVTVYIDDVLVRDPGSYLYNLGLDHFAEIQYLTPTEAGWRYGSNAGSAGVLLLRTKRGTS